MNKKEGILLDTNILVRALIDKNETLAGYLEGFLPVHIPLPVIFETVFVLEKIYKQPRNTIVDYISTILSYENTIAEMELIRRIMDLYLEKPKLSVIDCFLSAYAKTNGLILKSFDKKLSKTRA